MANSSVFGAIMAQISGHRGTETRRKILSLHWRIRFYCNIPGVRVRSVTLRARQEIRCAFWRERRAGRCKAPRRRRCGDIVEERQRRRCPPAAAPLRAAARRPAGCVARSLHTAAAERGTHLTPRAFPRILGAWTFAVSTLAPSYWNGFKSWSAGIRLFLDVPCPVAFVAGWIGGRRTADCRR